MTAPNVTLEEMIAAVRNEADVVATTCVAGADEPLRAAIATLQSLKDAGEDVGEPRVETCGLCGTPPTVSRADYDTLLSDYKRVCVERNAAKNYVADKEAAPTRIEFSNGRVVVAVGGYLEVEK